MGVRASPPRCDLELHVVFQSTEAMMADKKHATKKATPVPASSATPTRYAHALPPAERRALLESLPKIQLPRGETSVDLVRAVRSGVE